MSVAEQQSHLHCFLIGRLPSLADVYSKLSERSYMLLIDELNV